MLHFQDFSSLNMVGFWGEVWGGTHLPWDREDRTSPEKYTTYTYIYYSAHSLIRVFQWLVTLLEQTEVDCELTKGALSNRY
jgi:hypothetical protein